MVRYSDTVQVWFYKKWKSVCVSVCVCETQKVFVFKFPADVVRGQGSEGVAFTH